MQTVISDSLRETEDFDVIKSRKMEHKAQTVAKTPEQMTQNCAYCGSGHPCRQYPAYGKMCGKTNHCKALCRNNDGRREMVHEIEEETTVENSIDIVNINSIRSSSK